MPYYDYDNCNLYYEIQGEGSPVLLIHGWGIDHHYLTGCMEPVFHKYPNLFKRYYIDLPGMGKSTPGNIRHTNDIVALLLRFTENVINSDTILLTGNSYGGMICRALATQIPDKIRGMILICPTTGLPEHHLPSQYPCKKDEEFLQTLTAKELYSFCSMNVVLTKEAWERYSIDIYPAILANETNDFLNHTLDGSLPDCLNTTLPVFDAPVLLLTGKQDSCVGYEDQFVWIQQYPRITYLALEGAGHNLPIDRPEIFRGITIDWLNMIL